MSLSLLPASDHVSEGERVAFVRYVENGRDESIWSHDDHMAIIDEEREECGVNRNNVGVEWCDRWVTEGVVDPFNIYGCGHDGKPSSEVIIEPRIVTEPRVWHRAADEWVTGYDESVLDNWRLSRPAVRARRVAVAGSGELVDEPSGIDGVQHGAGRMGATFQVVAVEQCVG